LNYHKNNFTQTIIGGYNEDNYQASNKIENQLFLDNEIRKINSDDTNNYSMPSLSSTSEWELNDKNNLGVIVELLQSNSNSNNNSTGNITKNDILFNDYSMEQYAKYKNAMLSSNVFYKYYDKTKNKIFDVNLGVNYSANNNDSNFLRNQTINPTQETTKIIDHTEMRNYYLKLDYSQPLDSLGSSIETGAKFDFNNNTVPTDYYGFAAPLLENRFQYKDNVNSVYANYSSKFFKKLEVRLGLRYEYIFLNLHQQIGEQSRKDSYGKLLPNLLLKYTFTPNFNISTSYSHNLSRPYYTEYNPFETPTSDGNYYRGNLDLVANTNHRFTMKFGVYKKYFLSLVYGFTNQDYWTDYVKDGDKLIETSANFLGKSERY
jgi:outer membrane receptor protein involved in Fe transport